MLKMAGLISDYRNMRLFYGLLILIGVGHFTYGADVINNNNAVIRHICEDCVCNAKESFVKCHRLSLSKLYEPKDWTAVNSSDNAAALINIEFDENGLEEITVFPRMNTRSLSFRHNKIAKIQPRAFYDLMQLETLDLSDNRLTNQALKKEVFEGHYAATEYEPLKGLKWLSLAKNEIHALDADLFDHLDNLETLILAQNPFTVIDPNSGSAISNLTKLQVLDLSELELRDIPEHMLHAPKSLHTLNLARNIFTNLPEGLRFARNLLNLNFNDNPIIEIGGLNSFPELPKLETLNLSYSHTLKTIGDGAFQNLSALLHFDCRYNSHLSSIHPHAFANSKSELQAQWPPIQSLLLYGNNLTSLDENLIEHWADVKEIDIGLNKWKCACENQLMVDKLIPLIKEKSKDHPVIYGKLKCESPIEMKGKLLSELSAKGTQMRCEDYYGRRPERDGPILVGVFIGLMVGIPVTLALLFIYRRGCFGIFGYRPNPADYGRAYYKRTELREDLHI